MDEKNGVGDDKAQGQGNVDTYISVYYMYIDVPGLFVAT